MVFLTEKKYKTLELSLYNINLRIQAYYISKVFLKRLTSKAKGKQNILLIKTSFGKKRELRPGI